MAVFPYTIWRWLATMATVVWGIGIEPKCLTDRTQMCFTIIPHLGGSGVMITGGNEYESRQPKGRRDIVRTQKKRGSDES